MARVYVGTYKKYNEGSLAGAWLDLNDFKTYDDFLRKCREVHKSERDPEFMIQDSEGFPDGLDCLEWLCKDDFDDVKKAMSEEEKPNISIVDYSEKAFAVVGDTRSVKDDLKKLGGRFNGKLSCGAGWIFSNKSREAVEKFISSGEVSSKVKVDNTPKEGQKFVNWLNEFIDNECPKESDKKYYKKEYVGAIKFGTHYWLIDKPSIKNKFCFRDEGPDYEHYCKLHDDDSLMRKYFISENESEFTDKLNRIYDGEEIRLHDQDYRHMTNLYIGCWSWGESKQGREATEEEKKLLMDGINFGLSLFRKRLDSYLKRYGTSKLHTWTYWADA